MDPCTPCVRRRSMLRWGGRLEQVAAYVAILLNGGEYSQLYCTLASMPELAVDEKQFNDIRVIFNMYDEDGSGELDKEEFVAVLGCAGFDKEEAEQAFEQV